MKWNTTEQWSDFTGKLQREVDEEKGEGRREAGMKGKRGGEGGGGGRWIGETERC